MIYGYIYMNVKRVVYMEMYIKDNVVIDKVKPK